MKNLYSFNVKDEPYPPQILNYSKKVIKTSMDNDSKSIETVISKKGQNCPNVKQHIQKETFFQSEINFII